MAYATVNYTEPKQSTYQSIEVHYKTPKKKERKKFFNTGDPIVDYYDYMLWLGKQKDGWYLNNPWITWSSSIDHFFMDGRKWVQKYFNVDTWEEVSYSEVVRMSDEETNKLIKAICYPRHKSFSQVKRYYKMYKGLPLTNLKPQTQNNA